MFGYAFPVASTKTLRRVDEVTSTDAEEWKKPVDSVTVVLSPEWTKPTPAGTPTGEIRRTTSDSFRVDLDEWAVYDGEPGYLTVRAAVTSGTITRGSETRIDLGDVAEEIARLDRLRREEEERLARLAAAEAEKRALAAKKEEERRATVDRRIDELIDLATRSAGSTTDLATLVDQDLELVRLLLEPHRGTPEDREKAAAAARRAVSNATRANDLDRLELAINAQVELKKPR